MLWIVSTRVAKNITTIDAKSIFEERRRLCVLTLNGDNNRRLRLRIVQVSIQARLLVTASFFKQFPAASTSSQRWEKPSCGPYLLDRLFLATKPANKKNYIRPFARCLICGKASFFTLVSSHLLSSMIGIQLFPGMALALIEAKASHGTVGMCAER